jgi:hypothetical protein
MMNDYRVTVAVLHVKALLTLVFVDIPATLALASWFQRLRHADRVGGWKSLLEPLFEGLLEPPPFSIIAL